MKTIAIILLIAISNIYCFEINEYIDFEPKVSFSYIFDGFDTSTYQNFQTDREYAKKMDIGTPIHGNGKFFTRPIISNYGSCKSKIGIEIKNKQTKLSIYFDNVTYMDDFTKGSFIINTMEFYSGVKYTYSDKIKVTFEHLCIHPVMSDGNITHPNVFGGYKYNLSVSYGY